MARFRLSDSAPQPVIVCGALIAYKGDNLDFGTSRSAAETLPRIVSGCA